MTTALQVAHALASLIVLAEALNKLERTAPTLPGLSAHERLLCILKSGAWGLLAMGAGGGVASPVLLWAGLPPSLMHEFARLERPTLAETLVMAGFAVLIVRTRVKEG